jgi:hypothetical protein
MAAITYDQMLKQAIDKGQIADASGWFVDTFAKLKTIDTSRFIRKAKTVQLTGSISIGSMYLFHYDPKHKATLPLYDRYPLIFPFDTAPGGFYGVNFHYLPYLQRAKLLDSLMRLTNDRTITETTRLNMNYRLLKSVAKIKFLEPCIKQYLNNHVRSRFLYVPPQEWSKALFLPLDDFVYKKK